ncbi:10471_t:CDS:2 [Paraglomus brasilianum]|uniref:Serine/threonine-protein kinase 1 n=1 Tax=Paraglomus brasilianum TaxID=144538 RepID=A0A9N9F7A7_9GLOM|nr:10471_t:CDS:2 [Paraglomus brasilianum]
MTSLNVRPEDSEKTIVCDTITLSEWVTGRSHSYPESNQVVAHRGINVTLPLQVSAEYTIQTKLASGTFGSVFYGEKKSTSRPVAIKIVEASMAKTVLYNGKKTPKEAALLQKIPLHPNIINLIDWAEAYPKHWVFIFEYHGYGQDKPKSTLRHYLRDIARSRGQGLTENEARNIMRQLLAACSHLEKHGVYHGDLKLGNVVINPEGNIKLIDFGLAVEVERGLGRTGSIFPPEMYDYCIPYELSTAQIWVLGAVFYQLFEATNPFHEERIKSKALGPVMFNRYNRPSNECVELIDWMLKVEPNHRPQSVNRVISHGWFGCV